MQHQSYSCWFLCPPGIEDLREKREGVMKQIADEELEKAKIQTELQALTKRLAAINESLARKIDTR
jgi:Sjoegren syndrome nuclear autoantigen 1